MPLPNGTQHQADQGQKRKRDFNKKVANAANDVVFKNPDFAKDVNGLGKPKEQPWLKKGNGVNGKQRDGADGQKKADGCNVKQQDRNSSQKNANYVPKYAAASKSAPQPLTEKRKKLLRLRSELPIASHATRIRLSLHGLRDVLLLVGETGSGKSTQVPQFLMDEDWCTGLVAITQPRRVAAISLARRVADEMGTTLGNASPASKVGYSVRFDQNVAPACKVKFLTEGMILQELLRDPWLKEYSVVVVDEVHERGVNVDLVLGFLRRILVLQNRDEKKARKGKGRLKVVVMSATADTEALWKFFEEGFTEMEELRKEFETGKSNVAVVDGAASGSKQLSEVTNGISNGSANQVGDESTRDGDNDATSESSWSGFTSSSSNAGSEREDNPDVEDELPKPYGAKALQQHTADLNAIAKQHLLEVASDYISTCHIEGRQHPVQIFYAPESTNDFVEAALKTIFQIHYKEPLPGDVLVFLTGQDTVESLERLVNEHAAAMGTEVPKLLVLPLFAALPQNLQSRIFNPAPSTTRKIILATNIAETSLTIPGIVHVVDSGLAKIKEHRPSTGLSLSSLLVKPISKSSALQRAGRAGREGPGKCWRLYLEKEYLKLEEATKPEMLRSDVADAVLVMKSRGVPDPFTFPLLDRPPADEMRRAMLGLLRLGALKENGDISADGKRMAKLPLTPNMARVLVSAGRASAPPKSSSTDPSNSSSDSTSSTTFPNTSTTLAIIDIIASLTAGGESLFLPLQDEIAKAEADVSRHELLRREGDHLTFLATVRAYAAEHSDRKSWCQKRGVSHRAMRNVMDVRRQLRGQCVMQGLLAASAGNGNGDGNDGVEDNAPLTPEQADEVLKHFLAGFASNVALLRPDGSYKTVEGNQTVAIHPGSVMFGRKVEAIVYDELVFTSKCYARGVSAVRVAWWQDVVGA